jgi:hypothetical protein
MKVAELVKINSGWMKMMSKLGIRLEDHEHIVIFEEFLRMEGDGEKKEYIYAMLAEKYGRSKRTLQRLIKRLKSEC